MSRPRVHITEECLREGMQIESSTIAVEAKVRLLDALSKTGLSHIVVGSFVSPRYTPQMGDIDELVARFTPEPGVRYSALALNERGRDRMAAWMPPLSVTGEPPSTLCHMCETFVRRNANVSQAQEIASWPQTTADAASAGATHAGIGVNAVFGSNFEGPMSLDDAFVLLADQHELWARADVVVDTVWLGDPMGWCTPDRVRDLIAGVRERWPSITHLYFHLHDARGLALASSWAAVDALDDGFDLYLDATAGGIGGCPYCGTGRATGLAATEDLVNLLEQMGIETGVDLARLIEAVWLLEEIIGRPAFGRVSKAGPPPTGDDCYDANLPVIETFAEARHFERGAGVTDPTKRPWRTPIPTPRQRRESFS
jgi:hydroxymethylglutaryl-CoA lyase